MKFVKFTKFLICLTCILGFIDLCLAEIYTVKKGDTLSKILKDKKLLPVYGVNGTIVKIVKINSFLQKSGGHIIYPGMKLNLDIENNQSELGTQTSVSVFTPNTIGDNQQKNQNQEHTLTDNHISSRSDFAFAIVSEFERIKTTGEGAGFKADMLSDLSKGFRLSWGQIWGEKFKSSLNYQVIKVNIQESDSEKVKMINKSNSITQFQLGTQYEFSSGLKFINFFSYGEKLVGRFINSSTFSIDKFLAPMISIGVDYKIYQIDSLTINGMVSLSALLPATQEGYESRLSMGKKLGINLTDSFGSFKLENEFYYQNTNLKMSKNFGYEQTSIGTVISIKKELGVSK